MQTVIFSLLVLVASAAGYSSMVNLCLCTVKGGRCAFVPGILHQEYFISTASDGQEVVLPLRAIKANIFPKEKCAAELVKNIDRRFLIKGTLEFGSSLHTDEHHQVSGDVHGQVHTGLLNVGGHVDVDQGGHLSGGVEGKVNVDGVEVGGKVDVDHDGHVSGGASLGVGLGSLGGIDVHVNAGHDGVSAGVGAHVDVGPVHAHGDLSTDVHQ